MWLMLQQDKADDYVIGTGEAQSVRGICRGRIRYAELDWQEHVEIDPRYFRPTEVPHLCADTSKARRQLGWQPKISINDLVAIMVDADLEANGIEPIGKGPHVLSANFSHWHQWSSAVTKCVQIQ